MSVEEEIELRDLVAQTLETNGCLAKIRAQLRASIFLALDEDVKISKQQPLINNKVKTHLETEEGKIMFSLVREFLEFFNLYFTLSVFDPESYMGTAYKYESREKVAKDLGLNNEKFSTVPLLLQLIKIAQANTKGLEINLNKSDVEENELTHDNSTSKINKTESDNASSDEINVNANSDKLLIENFAIVPEKLNTTFELRSPTMDFNILQKTESNMRKQSAQTETQIDPTGVLDYANKKEDKDDDTYGDTSSIAEDSISLANISSNITVPEFIVNGIENMPGNESVNGTEVKPICKEIKAVDKSKTTLHKPEKTKVKNSLSTLSDLPPLQLNKSRVNDILPSLYSKEFKDKSNIREFDKLFDMEAEYEEDFICSGDDLSLKSDYLKSDHLNFANDSQLSNNIVNPDKAFLSKIDLKPKVPNRILSDCNKQQLKSSIHKSLDTVRDDDTTQNSETHEISSGHNQ